MFSCIMLPFLEKKVPWHFGGCLLRKANQKTYIGESNIKNVSCFSHVSEKTVGASRCNQYSYTLTDLSLLSVGLEI